MTRDPGTHPRDPAAYLRELGDELSAAGIRGAGRRRILDEFADHLHEDPEAPLGDPGQIATRFADELGTSLARDAALKAFAALAVAGVLIAVRILTLGRFNQIGGHGADTVALLVCGVTAQISFAAGTLALLRAFVFRGRPQIPRREATILARRAATGLVAGALTTIALPMRASMTPPAAQPAGAPWLSYAAMAVALAAIALAVPAVVRAARTRPVTGGPAGDLLTDLGALGRAFPLGRALAPGRLVLTRRPTTLALLLAGGLALAATLAGVAADDPYDGALRGLLEGGACLTGYGLLGRYLGLK